MDAASADSSGDAPPPDALPPDAFPPDASLSDARLDAAPDAAPEADCPTDAPDNGAGMMGACCYRKQNGAGAAQVELRLAELDIQEPAALSGQVVSLLLRDALSDESFSWLVSISGAEDEGVVTVSTGYGDRNSDDTFSFAVDNAPTANGSADRWNPAVFDGFLAGELLTSLYDGIVTLPIGGREQSIFELPLRTIQVSLLLSEMRSCVGQYTSANGYDVSKGQVITFVRVADVSEGTIAVLGDSSLCNFIGEIQSQSNCEEVARSEWGNPPNALCDDSGCVLDPGDKSVCDPLDDCNAWRMSAQFAAHGVEIK